MQYEIRGGFLVPDLKLFLSEEKLVTKKYVIPCEEITEIDTTVGQNGALSVLHKGKYHVIPYSKKDDDKVQEFVDYIKNMIVTNKAKKRALNAGTSVQSQMLNIAENMYQYCLDNNLGIGFNKDWSMMHFQLLENALMPKENVIMPFIGLNNYTGISQHDGHYAYAITDKRILMAQAKLSGNRVRQVDYNNINDITMSTGMAMGTLVIDTFKEKLIIGIPAPRVNTVYSELNKALEVIKENRYLKVDEEGCTIATKSSKSQIDKIKEWKELLDLNIITQAEFEVKKKELLNL